MWTISLYSADSRFLGEVECESRQAARDAASWYRTMTDGHNKVARTRVNHIVNGRRVK